MKIKKYQGGGFLPFTPIVTAAPTVSQAQSQTQQSSKYGILDDKTFEFLINKGGLINDVNQFVKQLSDLQSSSFTPFTDSYNSSRALQLISKVNELRETKSMWEGALKHAESQDSLGEVAVGSSGEVYTKDKDNKIVAMSVGDYTKKKDSVRLLTNNELLYERQYNPQLTGHSGIINVAGSSVGLNKITDHIKSIISAFGTEEISDTKVYSRDQVLKELGKYAGKQPTEEEAIAVKKLMDIANTPGELYKVKTENSSERRQAMKAAKYIWDTLGDAAQKKLTATAAMNGRTSVVEIILDMISTDTNVKESNEILPIAEPGTSSSTSGEKNLTQFQLFHKDKLMNQNLTFALNDPKFATMFRGSVGGVSPIITPDGNNVGMNTVSTILNSGYNQFLKGNNVFFGDKKVSAGDLNNIIYDGQDAAKVYMPVGADGSPDYEAFGKFKDIYAIFEANKSNWTQKQAEDHFKRNGYNLKVDVKYEDGKQVKIIRDNAYVKPFLVMYGYTNDATDLVKGNENWLQKLTSDEESQVVPMLESIWTVGKGKAIKNMTPAKFWNIEEYYKGLVAIPYREDATAIVDAMVGLGPREKQASMVDVQRNINYSSNQPLNNNVSSLSLKND